MRIAFRKFSCSEFNTTTTTRYINYTYNMGNDPHKKDVPEESECFPGNVLVETKLNGKKCMHNLEVGEEVKVIFEDGNIGFSEVWTMAHKDTESKACYLQIETETKRLTISHFHFIPVTDQNNSMVVYKMAKDIDIGDHLSTVESNQRKTETVIKIEEVEATGIFAPFTISGSILVNDVHASVYAEVEPDFAHSALAPFREKYYITPKDEMEAFLRPNENGVPTIFAEAFKMLKQLVPSY
ncbi:desert hedgehog protein [Patella vulgata]|uniref:desert hedgehog protein n=1 Tax=Patella vulgata TaxID=6465 RepID=UPI00217FA804|nr:desert hedgehog protein [Patella vulgata]